MADETKKNINNQDDDKPQNANWTVVDYINHLKRKTAKHHAYKVYSKSEQITCIQDEKVLYLTDGHRWNDLVDKADFCLNSKTKRYARCFSFSISENVACGCCTQGRMTTD